MTPPPAPCYLLDIPLDGKTLPLDGNNCMTDSTDGPNRRRKKSKHPRPMGRPTKYNKQRHKKICEYVARGLSREKAARLAGIGTETLYDWMRHKPDFSEDIKKSDVEWELKALENIDQAADDGYWQAAAWKLERKFPDEYGRRLRVDRTVDTDPRRFVPREDGTFELVDGHNEMLDEKPADDG